MAHILTTISLLLLLFITTAAAAADAGTLPSSANLVELETMKITLNSRGYTLFSNAISTSDLQFQFLSPSLDINTSYTIFAAKNFYMYALDMASDASAYVSTLRYHVIPNRRLTHSELTNLTSPFLKTLLPHFSVMVSRQGNDTDLVMVDGVRVSDPDMFVGGRIVVHGLEGILVTGIVKSGDLIEGEGPGVVSSVEENATHVTNVEEHGKSKKRCHGSHNHQPLRHGHGQKKHRKSRGHRKHSSHDGKEDL